MCGIIGYVGKEDVMPILRQGLRRLEYRGYDSAGVALLNKEGIYIRKSPGKLEILSGILEKSPVRGNIGMGHVRWATHGAPTHTNAHPHTDCSGEIVIVHNGIIENYDSLKEQLVKEGHGFYSETDTEVVAHLIEKYYKGDLEKAVRQALKEIKGSYALGIMSKREPDKLIGARCGSPLIVGISEKGNFIASDIPAILDYTNLIIYLNDGEMAVITQEAVEVKNMEGKVLKHKTNQINWDISRAEKGGYPHFMLKEIFEQPEVFAGIYKSRVEKKNNNILFEELKFSDRELAKFKEIYIVACGTAYHAGLLGKYIIENFAHIPVNVDTSSEFRYRNLILTKDILVLGITQSGETADTLACIREAKRQSIKTISICNVVGSSMARESDGVIYTHAGPEIGVASTKAYTAQLAIIYLLAIKLGFLRKRLDEKTVRGLLDELENISSAMEELLKEEENIKRIAKKFSQANCFLYLARGINFPNALEGALKLKEISYVHAEGYPAGEMKHGPIALIDEKMPVVCL
ncbi:MAG: glutamine--fructose-6-phosphate transaminase (isomerizing), partial [Candidatus Omnitrophica bacterium]|nr:glutamine--fructose-6-phosphate transaminase (isomerizing) [Candidatus Omnitrophota bacterium]